MAIFDTSAYANMLKIKYGPALVSQVNDKVVVGKLFQNDKDSWEGAQIQYPILVGRGQSFMAHGSLGLLPTAQNETTQSVIIPIKWVRGRIVFEVALMKQSARNSGSWARGQQLLMDRLVTNIADEYNRMLVSGAGTGTLALLQGAATGTTTLTLGAPGGIASVGYGSRFIQPGQIIAITDGATIFCIRQVVSIATETATTSTIVVDNAVTAGQGPDTSRIVRAADPSVTNLTRDTSFNNEPMGLEGIVDDGTLVNPFHNVNSTTTPDWAAIRFSVGALSLDALQRLYDTIDQQSGEPPTDNIVSHSMRRQYLALQETARVFMQTGKNAQAFDLGQAENKMDLRYNDLPINTDRDAQFGEWMSVNRNHLCRYPLVEGEWADETGSPFRAVPGQDALEAIWRAAFNYSTDKRNSHGKLVGMGIANALSRHIA
jgi:hypothetical protein